MIRIWVAGPRAWSNPKPVEVVMRRLVAQYGLARVVFVTGGAPGVDTLAVKAARELKVPIFENKAVWDLWNRKAGPIRNRLIAEIFQPDLLVAFHYYDFDGTNHLGTQSAIRNARKVGAKVKTIRVKQTTAEPSLLDPAAPGKAKRAARKRQKKRREP